MVVDIEALKARHPILEVARDLGLEVNHNRFRCPRNERHSHGDRTPSVSLWPDKGAFKCWVCPDVKGDVIDLVRIVRNTDFTGAIAFLEKHSGYSPHPGPVKHHLPHTNSQSQVELFQASPSSVRTDGRPPQPTTTTAPPDRRLELIAAFLELCHPVRGSGKAVTWLKGRRIFKKTWDGQKLRVVENYGRISDELAAGFSSSDLRDSGLFNAEGHLRFYRHPLVLPYFDREGRAVYLQARALETDVKPKELSLAGAIPCPYNARILDGEPGLLYLCEGVVDCLTLIEAGFPSVGIPGAANLKPGWIPLFRNKSVYVVFDADAAGEAGTDRALALFADQDIEAHRIQLPAGKDINDWLRSGGLGAI